MNGVLYMRKMSSDSFVKRAAMLVMLVIACFALSACYMDPDRVVDNQNGLNMGGTQQFENVITPTPSATPGLQMELQRAKPFSRGAHLILPVLPRHRGDTSRISLPGASATFGSNASHLTF